MSRARHPLATKSRSKSILIEGWRATNHSLALVNQYQILELRKLPHLRLFHADAPLHTSDWNKQTATSGFSASDRQRIDTPSPPATRRSTASIASSPVSGSAQSLTGARR